MPKFTWKTLKKYNFLVIGFPVPYIGILTDEGFLASTISPILDFKYHNKVIELKKLPTPGFSDGCGHNYWLSKSYGHIIPLYHKDEIIFLYANAKSLAVRYNITQVYCAMNMKKLNNI